MPSLSTIGTSGKSAERFFALLADAGVRRVIDTRRHPASQLAGYAKQGDLRWLLARVARIDYRHELAFAPDEDALRAHRAGELGWDAYAARYRRALVERGAERLFEPELLADACLLCSEPAPHRCHRSLLADYLRERIAGLEVRHLQ